MPRVQIFETESTPANSAAETSDAMMNWLKSCGVDVVRQRLDAGGTPIPDDAVVRPVIEAQGAAALPLVLVDGAIVSAGALPARVELARVLGLGLSADEKFLRETATCGVQLGLALSRGDLDAVSTAYDRLRRLGFSQDDLAEIVRQTRHSVPSLRPEVEEALDRLLAFGTVQNPKGACRCS